MTILNMPWLAWPLIPSAVFQRRRSDRARRGDRSRGTTLTGVGLAARISAILS